MPPGSSFFLQKARLTEQTTQNTRIFHPISADSNAAAAAADLSTSAAAHQFSEVSLIRARPARPVDSRDESKMEKKRRSICNKFRRKEEVEFSSHECGLTL